MHPATIKRLVGIAMLTAMGLLLSACLLTPGKFTSSLDLRRSGDFTFTYRGEISLIGATQLARMNRPADVQTQFSPSPCYADDSSETSSHGARTAAEAAANADAGTKERTCTTSELADQKQAWERGRQETRQREQQETDKVKTMLGGLDPTDPRSLDEFAAKLRRQAGWRAVTHKGNGLFDVDFAVSGRLDHDFVFPLIERFPNTNTFVQLMRRNDGTVRIDAPGFAPSANGSMFSWMALGNFGSMGRDSTQSMRLTDMDGIFTVTTDGQVLANNTDSGPKATPSGQQLDWTVNVRSAAAPMALLRLDK